PRASLSRAPRRCRPPRPPGRGPGQSRIRPRSWPQHAALGARRSMPAGGGKSAPILSRWASKARRGRGSWQPGWSRRGILLGGMANGAHRAAGAYRVLRELGSRAQRTFAAVREPHELVVLHRFSRATRDANANVSESERLLPTGTLATAEEL